MGITLFEMLTGRVPFNGETTVAIAIKHIQEEMPSPREYVPEIPVCVEQIVLKCTQKSPDRRYHSMAALIADLKKALIARFKTISCTLCMHSMGTSCVMKHHNIFSVIHQSF